MDQASITIPSYIALQPNTTLVRPHMIDAHLKVKSQVVAHNQWQMLISRLLYYQCQVPVPYFELTHDCVFVLQNLPSRQLRVMGL